MSDSPDKQLLTRALRIAVVLGDIIVSATRPNSAHATKFEARGTSDAMLDIRLLKLTSVRVAASARIL